MQIGINNLLKANIGILTFIVGSVAGLICLRFLNYFGYLEILVESDYFLLSVMLYICCIVLFPISLVVHYHSRENSIFNRLSLDYYLYAISKVVLFKIAKVLSYIENNPRDFFLKTSITLFTLGVINYNIFFSFQNHFGMFFVYFLNFMAILYFLGYDNYGDISKYIFNFICSVVLLISFSCTLNGFFIVKLKHSFVEAALQFNYSYSYGFTNWKTDNNISNLSAFDYTSIKIANILLKGISNDK